MNAILANACRLAAVAVLASTLATPAVAADRVLMEVDCHDRAKPPLQAFARRAGTDNILIAQKLRSRAWAEAMRKCHGGFDRVLVVTGPAPATDGRPGTDEPRVVAR